MAPDTLDVVFPSDEALSQRFQSLKTGYVKHRWTLNGFIEYARPILAKGKWNVLALGSAANSDDVWCLDSRGTLSLAVGKETYEQLGMVGSKLPWKPKKEMHIIRIPLVNREYADKIQASPDLFTPYSEKTKTTLVAWDAKRVDATNQAIIPQVRRALSVRVPQLPLSTVPPTPTSEGTEDWEEEVSALFEWVGLASLDSQRLRANDRVDPYLAVYDPPLQLSVGDVMCIRWSGLLSPSFVQSVLNIALANDGSFIAVTGQAVTNSPVGYISPLPPVVLPALHAPTKDGEDTWSLVLTAPAGDNRDAGAKHWMLVESIGPYDARLG
ncbi:hypothetical protein EIP91_007735 [Steccherinum ochraceum]|uniref:Uncharacterized protein n=1 Tax=Steccherinum ochraceum TaxID=92696 RepID=A0A4R0RYK8_9APHY|nr:hypothetical protein EIP91_007735 [Steccherinum ochraceum]